MSLQIAIVGLPNVGKSTLFSAITKKQVDCANYPFCTIDPNVGVVEVPDGRLSKLAQVDQSQRIVPTAIEFVDVAGLVKGASEGQGLGNKFLSHIRETDAIAQVVRAFDDPNVLHVDGSVQPARDAETVNIELVLKDLETVGKRLQMVEKQAKAEMTKALELEVVTLIAAQEMLSHNQMLRDGEWSEDALVLFRSFALLTIKPMMYVVNISEAQLADGSWNRPEFAIWKAPVVPVSIKMEAELAGMSLDEKTQYLQMCGQDVSGLDRLIQQAYETLVLITFLTSGPDETRAWTIRKGTKAPQAAGKVHSDFEKNFIRAEVTPWQDYVANGGETGCRVKGLTRIEGKDYIVHDGDVCFFRVG